MLPTAVMVAQGQHYRLHMYYIEEEEREREGWSSLRTLLLVGRKQAF